MKLPDKTLEQKQLSPRDKLLARGGVTEKNVDAFVEIITKSQSVQDIRRGYRDLHWTCDVEQFFIPIFRRLYITYPQIQEAAIDELQGIIAGFDLPADVITQYFVEMGEQPYLIFAYKYKKIIGLEKLDEFVKKSREVMFRLTKEWLTARE